MWCLGDIFFIVNCVEGFDGVWVVCVLIGELFYLLIGWIYNGKNEKFDN